MSEYTTYACDICGKHESLRLDVVTGHDYDMVNGYTHTTDQLDLCPEHMREEFERLLSMLTPATRLELTRRIVSLRKKGA